MKENKSGLDSLLEQLRKWQCEPCEPCKNGDNSKCPKSIEEGAKAYIEEPDGSRRYFCCVGCMLLEVYERGGDGALTQAIERQFNREGHGLW